MPPSHIAVLGGGLTGLSSAFHLSKRYPTSAITLLEKSPRLGGWVNSERVTVQDDDGNEASMLLEAGPKLLRPQSKAVLELINLLNLRSSVITVPKSAPAARVRFLHIPGTTGLTALPSSPLGALSSQLGRTLAWAAVTEPIRSRTNLRSLNSQIEDDSLEHFLALRLGPDLARILGSALVHGIYASDARELSVRAAFPSLWDAANRAKGSMVLGMLARSSHTASAAGRVYQSGDIEELMHDTSVYSFRSGMLTLVEAMTAALKGRSGVTLVNNDPAVALVRNGPGGSITVQTSLGKSISASHVVSAVPLPTLESIMSNSSLPVLPHLTANPSSSVTVANFIFPPTHKPIHPEGFGYLIPRAEDGTVEVLGTVFDSCSLSSQDEYDSAASPRFTKMTMMARPDPSLPPMTVDRVMQHLTKHLQPPTPLPVPVFFKAQTLQDCIPVPTPGHVQRMVKLKEAAQREWDGRLEVIGAGVGGVSVGDCIEQGREAGRLWAIA